MRQRPRSPGGVPPPLGRQVPKAVTKLNRDWSALTAHFDFPAEHWRHLRTTNPIESSSATVKLRTRVQKGAGTKAAALAMAYKLLDAASQRWRRCNGHSSSASCTTATPSRTGIRVLDEHPTQD